MESFNPIEFQQTRDFSKKINTTFEFLKQNFKPLFKSILFIAGPPMLIGSVLAGGLYSDYFGFIGKMGQNQGNPDFITDSLGSPLLWLEIAMALLFMFASGVMIISVVYNYMLEYQAKRSNEIEVNDIWNRVRDTLPMYIGTVLLYWVMFIAAYLLVVLIIVGAATVSPFLAFLVGVAVFIGLVYCIITLSLLFFIRAYEKIDFFESVTRSFFLIRDKWWSTFGLLFILGLVQSTIASLFLIPWYINFFVSMMHNIEGNPFQESSVFSELINNIFMTLYFIVSFLLYSLPLTALAFQYLNLVELKEAKGLLSKIENIGQPDDSAKKDEQY
ncbi:MAG: hypothetical protein OEU76_05480 [Cyclobacteriaceae bacterium]|nr:hypothetical protein [Cyclobacteriaceae bacterium]